MTISALPGTARGAEKICVLRARPRVPWLTLLAGLFAIVASLPEAAPLFEWRRAADPIQIWRPLTGHFAHWSTDHLSWDLLIFVVFGGLLEMRGRAGFVAVLATSSAVLGLLLPFVYPDMTAYRGLSGIDCALACAVAVFRMQDPSCVDRLSGWAMLVFIVSKTGFEWMSAGTLFVDYATADFEPLPGAHVLGGVVGAGLVAVCTTMADHVGSTARCPEDAVLVAWPGLFMVSVAGALRSKRVVQTRVLAGQSAFGRGLSSTLTSSSRTPTYPPERGDVPPQQDLHE